MKRMILLLAFGWFWTGLFSQEYQFELGTSTYTDLENPNELIPPGDFWDGQEWTVPIGFDFHFFGAVYDSTLFWEGTFFFQDPEIFLDAFGAVFIDRVLYTMDPNNRSRVGYRTDGPIGNRIFKFEVKNAGFFSGDADDFANYQLWLYEATSVLEVHFGPSAVNPEVYQDDGWNGPFIGIANFQINEFLYLDQDPLAPFEYTVDENTDGLDGTPPNGTVYRFIPNTSSTQIPEKEEVRLWVSDSQLIGKKLDSKAFPVWSMTDVTGRSIFQERPTSQLATGVLLPDLIPGVYWVTLAGTKGVVTKAIWIP
jgi:hypothetical protein